MRNLYLTNTLTRKKKLFTPVQPGHVGMYVCGPTVYGDAHLGHARPGVTYDILFKLLKHLGYKVRYVRNITDVGHLEHDADEGEDKITKKARLEQLEPMEVVQTYTFRYHEAMRQLNVAPPSIEPRASGHIIEQIATVQKILDAGYAYISNGSVYFDVEKYNKDYHYGILSGRTLDDTREGTRDLDGQSDKKAPYDFALWKKAEPEHIMHWPSPWSEGFPGWHLECSVMGEKYLGNEFDIHGGGMDLMFPHHECEIAQNVASRHTQGVHYWVHNNMITINGKKMGKSLGNFITLEQFFAGDHPLLQQAYSPMTIRFFILQAHYRGTVDFSNEALQGAERALRRLTEAYARIAELHTDDAAPSLQAQIDDLGNRCYQAIDDDFNTPIVLATLFEAAALINKINDHTIAATADDIARIRDIFDTFMIQILGLRADTQGAADGEDNLAPFRGAVDLLLDIRRQAKQNRDWTTSDAIRDRLAALGFTVKDTKDGYEWTLD